VEARAAFERCCGAPGWIDQMVSRRPFADANDALRSAQDAWGCLGPEEWLEAFQHHPRIGDLESLRKRFASTADLAGKEQAAVATAEAETLAALAEGNRAYEDKFGYIFIVFATGKTAAQMLDLLRARMSNEPDAELRIAAGEQWKIMRLRLARMLDVPQ
jgi:2-oxo-4-hydroxy-4-carboxy-5-ureidoimidazoline decarboxylase